jgi:hypothetical protein
MVSQRKISELQAFEIETADDLEIGPKASHELACRQVDGQCNRPPQPQLEDKISLCPSISNAGESTAHVNVAAQNDTLSNAQLKKKEVRTRSSKRSAQEVQRDKNLAGKKSKKGGKKDKEKLLCLYKYQWYVKFL